MNFNQNIKDIIFSINHVDLNNLKLLLYEDHKEMWDQFSSKINLLPIHYSKNLIDYLNIYNSEFNDNYTDLSIIFSLNNFPIAIWPLTISGQKDTVSLSSQKKEILAPLFIDNIDKIIKNQIYEIIFSLLDQVILKYKIKKIKYLEDVYLNKNFSEWYKYIFANNGKTQIRNDMYLDLTMNNSEIWKIIRRSYKSLINKASRKYEALFLFSNDKLMWNNFKLLHSKEAGKITRSEKSWVKQYENIINKKAILCYCLDDNQIIGGAFFDLSKDEAFYSVAAYDKEFRKNPISHYIIYSSIIKIKSLGIKKLNFGELNCNDSMDLKNLKESNIQKFKNGFTSNISENIILKQDR